MRKERGEESSGFLGGSSAFSGFARVLGSTGGISFHPGSAMMSDNGPLMFGNNDDSEDDDSGDEMETDGISSGRSFFSDTFGLGGRSRPSDPTQTLRDRLAAFEQGDGFDDDAELGLDGDSRMVEIEEDEHADGPFDDVNGESEVNGDVPKSPSPTPSPNALQGEAPPPPKPTVNGDATPVQQFKSRPLGDAPDPVVKADGLMDASEDPLKT